MTALSVSARKALMDKLVKCILLMLILMTKVQLSIYDNGKLYRLYPIQLIHCATYR